MKVKFTKLAALLLSGAALLAAGCTDYEVDIQKNADAIASANDQIKALQSTIATLETAADHKADVDKLNKAISDLETALNGKIAELTTEVNNQIASLEQQIAGINATMETLEKKADHDADIAALNTTISTLETALRAALDTKVDKDVYTAKMTEIAGHADKGTGNKRINQKLSEQRAAAVKAFLQERGIAEDRIVSVVANGDRVQPFAENDLNRVVISTIE